MFAKGKLLNKLFQNFCDSKGLMIYISEFWSDFIYAAIKVKNIIFQLYFPDSILAVNLDRCIFQ